MSNKFQLILSVILFINLGLLLQKSSYSQLKEEEKNINEEYLKWSIKYKRLLSDND